jgi:hypothetical protein
VVSLNHNAVTPDTPTKDFGEVRVATLNLLTFVGEITSCNGLLLSATSGVRNSCRPQLLRGAICDFQFAATREATVRKARTRSASAPALVIVLASPLALLIPSIAVRSSRPGTRAA